MSELPDADKASVGQTLVKQPYESMAQEMKPLTPPKQTSHEKPGTGKVIGDKKGDDKGGSSKPSTWSGSATNIGELADGYVMAREPDGAITLTDDVGNKAVWHEGLQKWYDEKDRPMPDEWSRGHKPAFSGHQSGIPKSPE